MPLVKRKYTRKPRSRIVRRRRVARRGARVALPKRTTGNFASATEQFSIGSTAGITDDFTFNMTDLVRTRALMDAYQYYRISSVELRFKPNYDTFQAQSTNMVPYLNFQYDKSGALMGMNAAEFEAIGTKAIRLDDKTIVRKWKPSVLTETVGGATQFKVSPWLPTYVAGAQNSLVDHYGATWYISKMSIGDVLGYDIDVIVNVQYRKPLVKSSPSQALHNATRITQTNVSGVDLSANPV